MPDHAELSAEICDALKACHAARGSLGGYSHNRQYVLSLWRGSVVSHRFTLTWPEYYAAFLRWQELLKPVPKLRGPLKRRAA